MSQIAQCQKSGGNQTYIAKLKYYQNWNVTKTDMSPKLKCHQIWNVTKTEVSPKLNCHQNWSFIKIKEIGTEYLGLVLCTLSILSGKFPDCLESFQIVWKLSRMAGKFSNCPESSFIFQKVFALCGMFLYHLESVPSFRQVKRGKRQSGKCCKHGLFPKII